MTPMVPFFPAGAKAFNWWLEEHEGIQRKILNSSATYSSWMPSNYGAEKRFKDWLWENYCADVVKHHRITMIRFLEPQQSTLFSLKWS